MKTSILVVDDEPVVRGFLVRVLEQAGYDVRAAHNGREAMQRLEESAFDVLLTDIKMDLLDGVQLLAQTKTHYPDTVVILLTGHATVQSAVDALRLGAHDYLLKPVKNEEILTAILSGLKARTRQRRADQLEQIAAQMLHIMQEEPGPAASEKTVVSCGPLQLDPEAYLVTLDGESLDLTPTEFRLLLTLTRAPGAALDYVRLVQFACGYTCTRQEAREIIGTHVLNLRQKLGIAPKHSLYIESVRGIGYRLIPTIETN